jgi:hypothetical protein
MVRYVLKLSVSFGLTTLTYQYVGIVKLMVSWRSVIKNIPVLQSGFLLAQFSHQDLPSVADPYRSGQTG